MTNKIWKLGSIAMIVAVGATMYYLGVSSSGTRTSGQPSTSHVAKAGTSAKSKITTRPTASTNAPSCTAAQLMVATPTVNGSYSPRTNSYGQAIGMNKETHAKVIENTSGTSCSLGGGIPKLERIVVAASQSAALSSASLPSADGQTINVEGQPPAGPVFTLAPAAKAEIWYLSDTVKPNPVGRAHSAATHLNDLVSCVEIWSIPTPSGPVTVPGPIQKCANFQPLFLNNYYFFYPLSQTFTAFLPKAEFFKYS
ncbi:hypothetical protein [Ferrimicrobium acidiphilum]|uniref:hypothetical protein n=1 Tax=Ferrimicrobium acidiphilum TaxID=121039 RepID=UPI0023EFD7DD|nr:hypothetical protein [Ferrimicrobium acidiphilum]